jgi:DNA-directed RNA polymerase beta subunit
MSTKQTHNKSIETNNINNDIIEKPKRKYNRKTPSTIETPIIDVVTVEETKPKRKYTRRKAIDNEEQVTSSSVVLKVEKDEIPVIKKDNYNWEKGAWQILKLMMNEPKFLIQHQVSSFNEFLDKGIKNVIAQFNTITLNYDYVVKQKFYRVKSTSSYAELSDNQWSEYNEISDIYQTFKDKYFSSSNKTITISLSDHNTATVEKERLLQSEFQSFIDEHIEYYNIDINKHRYDLEIDMIFHSLTPPTIFENNGSQKLMYPNDARIRNFTYASNLYIDVNFKTRERYGPGFINIKEAQPKTIAKVNCGKIPVMLGSKACILSNKTGNRMIDYEECEFDEGGYFIVNGTEKVIIGQERQAENKIYVFKNSKSQGKYSHICEVKSLPDKKIVTPKNIQVKITSKETIHGKNIKVSIPHITQDLPLFVVFKALGVISDYDIVNMILYNTPKDEWKEYTQFLLASLEETATITTELMAKEYMCKYVNMMGYDRDKSEKERRLTYLNDIINNDFLPHVGSEYKAKAFYLGHMVKLLLDVFLKKRDPDDRDSYVNKRIDTAGILMANLFRQYFTKLVKDMKTNINKEYTSGSWRSSKDFENILNLSNIYKVIKYSTITTGLKFALATGNWGIKNNNNKQGIAQVLSRLTYNSTLSHLRRVNTPMEKTSKLVAPRKLHGTQMMYMCGAETPEGGSVGVVKNLALSCHITGYADINPIIDILTSLDTQPIIETIPDEMFGKSKVFVNGNWLFITKYPKKLYDTLIHLRRTGIIHVHTSIVWNITDNMIEIYSDAGRCTRPLYILNSKGEFRITNDMIKKIVKGELNWNNLLVGTLHARDSSINDITEGVIEFIDVQEQDNCMIAVTDGRINENGTKTIYYKYTHCEIHPSFIQGVLASIIPFSDHNQSPRNCYQCLDIHETVLMANGSRKEIKDVKIGEEVITFNPNTMKTSITKVIHQYIRPTENKIYRIRTVSGREIIATGNHNFMTTDGWKSVDNMNNDTMIGILINTKSLNNNSDRKLILDETIINERLNETNMNKNLINTHISILKKLNYMPLYSDDDRIPILSRIIGYILTDGSLNIYNKKHGGYTPQCQADFGTEDDGNEFEEDINLLGFNKCKVSEGTRTFNGSTHHTFSVSHNGVFPTLLISLGISYGKTTETLRKPIPDWIMNGSDLVKREFISGIQGGDGCMIRWNKLSNNHFNFVCASTSQQINPKYESSLKLFMTQCVDIIKYFGIEVSLTESKKINDERIMIGYKIADKQANLSLYFDMIGYRYCYHKTINSAKVIEYIKIKNVLQENYHNLVLQIRNLYDNGKTNSEISKLVDIPISRISDIIRSYKNNRTITTSRLNDNYIDKWYNKLITKSKCIFVPIQSITEIENRLISDITVESDNHSFIAGKDSFLSSNSAMGKQAMGIYATNFRYRMDTVAHLLRYPQLPLVNSRVIKYLPSNDLPSGINVVVAIASFSGYNQEDSIIMNHSACQRGLFISDHYHTYKDEEKKRQSTSIKMQEKFAKPNTKNTLGTRGNNYETLTPEGFPVENIYVRANDAIIGKVHPIHSKTDDQEMYRCCSTIVNEGEEGFVDKVMVSRNGDGYRFAKIRIRNSRIPTVGDKHACYTPDHEVLTKNRGWINISDVQLTDTIVTMNTETNEKNRGWIIKYENPTEIQSYEYNGDIYKVETQQVSLAVTSNHRMWIDKGSGFRFYRADDMNNNIIKFMNMENIVDIKLNDINIINYTGKVYCCSVPSGILYVRRNGIPVWCGNSRHG